MTSTSKTSGNGSHAGGITGNNQNTSTVQNCYNSGNVTGSYNFIGGILGWNGYKTGTQTVKNVFNAGVITKGTKPAGMDIGKSATWFGYLIGGYGSLSGKYGNIPTKDPEDETATDMTDWDENTILENLGYEDEEGNIVTNFKRDYTANPVNKGYPILKWQ